MACAMYSLEGKVAVITGSSSGIGAVMAYKFAELGADIVLNGRNAKALEEVSKKCESSSAKKRKPLVVIADLEDEKGRVKIINDTVKHYGKMDILINNAGFMVSKDLSADLDTSRLDRMYNIHLKAPFHLIKLAIPHLAKTKGNIINIASTVAFRTYGTGNVEYSIMKAALDHLTRFAALELGPKGIRANSICPGATATKLLTTLGYDPATTKKIYEQMAKSHALGRVGAPEDVANLAAFLSSEASSFITGVSVPVEGGSLLVTGLDFRGPD